MAQSHYMFRWPLCDPPLHSAKQRVGHLSTSKIWKDTEASEIRPVADWLISVIPATAPGLWRAPRMKSGALGDQRRTRLGLGLARGDPAYERTPFR